MTTEVAPVPPTTSARRRPRLVIERWLRLERTAVPPRASWPGSLQRVHAYGLLLIVIWFFILAWWSSDLAGHFSLTFDYSFYAQAWYLIAHGHLNPYSSVGIEPYWHNAFETVVWPLAPLWYLWPHPVTLLWAQDAATAGCFSVLFLWMCELVAGGLERARLKSWTVALPACGVVLLVASPWPFWIDSFDFHPEALDLLIVLLTAHALWKGQSLRAWLWVLASLLSGALGATYVAGLGLSALLAGQRWRRTGMVLVALGVVWLVILSRVGGDHASGIYSDLTQGLHVSHPSTNTLAKIIIEHPSRAVSAIWSVHTDLYADLASGGVIGFFSPWSFGITLLVLLEGGLTGQAQFIEPYVQNSLPAIVLVPFGTVVICIALAASRHRWRQVLAALLAAIAVVNVLGWAHDWTRSVKPHYLIVPTASAITLRRALGRIPANAEVIVSQGVAGPFALRPWVYVVVKGPRDTYPIHSRTVWFVITPDIGIETEAGTAADAQIYQLIDHFHARLVVASHDVFVLKWRPRRGQRELTFSNHFMVPLWSLTSPVIFTRPPGPARTWHLTSATPGQLNIDDYWTVQGGAYSAAVRLASTGPVRVQLLDDSTGKVLQQETVPSTGGAIETRGFKGHFVSHTTQTVSSGSSVFQVDPVEPPQGDILQLRVVNLGTTRVSVYALGGLRVDSRSVHAPEMHIDHDTVLSQ